MQNLIKISILTKFIRNLKHLKYIYNSKLKTLHTSYQYAAKNFTENTLLEMPKVYLKFVVTIIITFLIRFNYLQGQKNKAFKN